MVRNKLSRRGKAIKLIAIILILAGLAFASYDLTGAARRGGKRALEENRTDRADVQLQRPVVKQVINPERNAKGEKLYLEYCFMCHGSDAEGAPGWKTPLEDGKYLAPPLNGSGHAWHHPMNVLRDYIKNGSIDRGGAMMGFEGALGDEETADIISWFQSKWPDELYSSWYWRDLGSKKGDSRL